MDEKHKSPRVIELPVSFSGDDGGGTGHIHNLSQEGRLIESDTPVRVGCYFQLSMGLPDGSPPLEVDLAAVRWVKGRVFGVELLYKSPAHCERLKPFLETT